MTTRIVVVIMGTQAKINMKGMTIKLAFDFEEYFNDLLSGTKVNPQQSKYSTEDELNDLYAEYQDLVNELKADGYKVMRNEAGKHKVIKSE